MTRLKRPRKSHQDRKPTARALAIYAIIRDNPGIKRGELMVLLGKRTTMNVDHILCCLEHPETLVSEDAGRLYPYAPLRDFQPRPGRDFQQGDL